MLSSAADEGGLLFSAFAQPPDTAAALTVDDLPNLPSPITLGDQEGSVMSHDTPTSTGEGACCGLWAAAWRPASPVRWLPQQRLAG